MDADRIERLQAEYRDISRRVLDLRGEGPDIVWLQQREHEIVAELNQLGSFLVPSC
ncbi:hypothetical protein DYI24_19850 [Rhodopseudomonas sp. BR0C11]|uniref:hypothetical protein n=1 Tax=Rhodopseudomonas sp. BR0C11 TaxID=2269370 RepID=UPI0013DF0026|nr:hypothetical protein [Rhodopseudomonas sp. BR0C11]NEV79288.1 hypothetical protein [Rhodopseudomonas sp. BR0C11]